MKAKNDSQKDTNGSGEIIETQHTERKLLDLDAIETQ
jgi:hypothetical protein